MKHTSKTQILLAGLDATSDILFQIFYLERTEIKCALEKKVIKTPSLDTFVSVDCFRQFHHPRTLAQAFLFDIILESPVHYHF